MKELLTIKKLGPIDELTIEPRPLTIIIGEQASGKSLVAQVLYFFRRLKTFVADEYSPVLISEDKWQEKVIRKILDDLRGIPFGYFANGKASLRYKSGKIDWGISIYEGNRSARPTKALRDAMDGWISEWSEDKAELGKTKELNHLFIPTERSVFTRLWGQAQSTLFAEHQPQPLRHFGEVLGKAFPIYQNLFYAKGKKLKALRGKEQEVDFIMNCQKRALEGEAYVPTQGPQLWKWKTDQGDKPKIIPIEAVASGQMEAWPFFVMASTYGIFKSNSFFYFEEPETHLHPRAQVEIMRTIAYLVNRGQQFVITTHSPFLMYVVNNMIQRHVTYKGNVPEGEDIALDPDDIVAYRLGKKTEKISDDEESRLLDLEELEATADELGGEFDRLLYMTDEAD